MMDPGLEAKALGLEAKATKFGIKANYGLAFRTILLVVN